MTQNKTLIEKTDILQKTALIMFTKDGLTATIDFQNGELIYEGNVPISESAKLLFESMKPYLTALQSEQAGVNGELLDALKIIVLEHENHYPAERKMYHIAKKAIANAKSCKPELTQPELGINNSIEKTNISQDVSNPKIAATFNDPRDEQIRILREAIERILKHSMASNQLLERRAEVVTICELSLAAADKLEATNANT